MSYYDDLSIGYKSDNASLSSHDSEDDDDDQQWLLAAGNGNSSSRRQISDVPKFSTLATGLWDRCILHLDIDCFYCQCEEIDRELRQGKEPIRPLAIGQKHIIVTSNYTAREYGVQKLQSREDAYAACPHLWIVEGSDLLCYRRHSRAVYEAFRRVLREVAREIEKEDGLPEGSFRIPAKKGCMDEMVADLTPAVDRIVRNRQEGGSNERKAHSSTTDDCQGSTKHARFVFGEDAPSSMAVLVEDQTGEKSTVLFQQSINSFAASMDPKEVALAACRRNIHNVCGSSEEDRLSCQRRLQIAADMTERLCYQIRQETGFHTTGGVSVSPLLAKLTSGLHKPKSINILYPWRSSQLLYSMPLRKMHKIGRRTAKVLEKEMFSSNSPFDLTNPQVRAEKDDTKSRVVYDLLEMPRSSIRQALRGLAAFHAGTSNEDQSDLLIQQCRGLDTSEIVDDEGGLPKTISVEDSFRRGSVRSLQAVNQALEELYRRLPMLLQDRKSWATDQRKAYPTTIRLTIRMLDPELALIQKRRPYVTKSKQSSIDGKRCFLRENDLKMQSNSIRQHIKPLLQELLPTAINVTRMNIAVTKFQDVAVIEATTKTGQATLAESLDRKGSSRSLQPSQSCVQEGSKRPKLSEILPAPTHVSPGALPSTTSSSLQGISRSSKLTRLRATRIDRFFVKK